MFIKKDDEGKYIIYFTKEVPPPEGSDENPTYVNVEVAVLSEVLEEILNFTNYIVIENEGHLQYAFILPIDTSLVLQDKSGCGVNKQIDGRFAIILSEESVNNCRTGEKVVKVESEQDCTYYIFNTNQNGDGYPLNQAELNGLIWQITDTVNGVYDKTTTNPQNLFSFQTKTKHLIGLVDESFSSQTLISGDNELEDYEPTSGYGTTGLFEHGDWNHIFNYVMPSTFNYPIFIVGETEDNLRALSPIYDYSFVRGLIKYGVLERKAIVTADTGGGEEGTGEEGSTSGDNEGADEGTLTVVSDYKLAIALKKRDMTAEPPYSGQFYLEYYDYRLTGICRIDDATTIEFSEQTLNGTGRFIFASISEALYRSMPGRLSSDIMVRSVINRTEITAYDITTLKHICGIYLEDVGTEATKWYTYIWVANMPKDENDETYNVGSETGGIYYNGKWYDYIEFIYEQGEEIDPMCIVTGETLQELGIYFTGWSEDHPGGSLIQCDTLQGQIAEDCKIYYGNWNVTELYTVIFEEEDGERIKTINGIVEGDELNPTEEDWFDDFTWYETNDEGEITEEEANFPQTINSDKTFKGIRKCEVNWIDNDDTVNIQSCNVVFYESEEAEQPISSNTVQFGQTVVPPTEYDGSEWYDRTDTDKNTVVFPYIVTKNMDFILKSEDDTQI